MSNNNESDYEDITSNVVMATKLDIGGSFQGKLLEIVDNAKYAAQGAKDLIMEDEDGKEFRVFTGGSLKYAIKEGKFEVGRTYKVTRLENKTVKGKSSTQFQIQRLRADGSTAAPTVSDSKPASLRN